MPMNTTFDSRPVPPAIWLRAAARAAGRGASSGSARWVGGLARFGAAKTRGRAAMTCQFSQIFGPRPTTSEPLAAATPLAIGFDLRHLVLGHREPDKPIRVDAE